MASSLQQAQAARDDRQAEVDDCIAAVDTAKGNVLLAYTLALQKTQDDLDAFCLQVLQTYPAAQSSQVIPAEQKYIDAYVALEEAKDELRDVQWQFFNDRAPLPGAENQSAQNAADGQKRQVLNARKGGNFRGVRAY